MSESYWFFNALSLLRSMEKKKQLKLFIFAFVNVAMPISKQLIFVSFIAASVKVLSSRSSETSILKIFLESEIFTAIKIFLALLLVLPLLDLIKLKSRIKINNAKNPHNKFASMFLLVTLELFFAIALCSILIALFSNLVTCFLLLIAFVIITSYSITFYQNPFIPKFLKRNFLQNTYSEYLGLTLFLTLFFCYLIYSNSNDIDAIHLVVMFLIPRSLFRNLAKWLRIRSNIINKISSNI